MTFLCCRYQTGNLSRPLRLVISGSDHAHLCRSCTLGLTLAGGSPCSLLLTYLSFKTIMSGICRSIKFGFRSASFTPSRSFTAFGFGSGNMSCEPGPSADDGNYTFAQTGYPYCWSRQLWWSSPAEPPSPPPFPHIC